MKYASNHSPEVLPPHYEGEGGVQSTFFCIFNHCYFISSPNKLKICHTIKQQLSIHNIMPKHENNALQKKITINLKRVLFLSNVPHDWGTLSYRGSNEEAAYA